jgi:methionyl-tRNA formyltransferase
MNILFFGDPAGGNALLDAGLTLVGVVHGRRGGAGLRRFIPRVRHLPRWSLPNLTDIAHLLSELKPDLIVASFYPERIPESVLAIAPGINVHPSDLPRWRGPDPCAWAIRAGDSQTAICVHWLTAGLDEGDVLRRTPVTIRPHESAGRLAERLQAQGALEIAEVAQALAQGQELEATPQTGEPSWAPLTHDDDWEIDWNRSAEEVACFVRAAAPDPGAFTGIGRELLVILSCRAVDAGQFDVLEPGTPFVVNEWAHIRCREGALRLGRMYLGRRSLNGHALARVLT